MIACDNCGGHGHNIGSLDEGFDPCADCDGSGYEPGYEVGDRVSVVDDETGAIIAATITDHLAHDWYEVAQDGIVDDLISVRESAIVATRIGPSLSLLAVEDLVAQIKANAAAPARKPAGNAHVAPVFAEILNAFGGVR